MVTILDETPRLQDLEQHRPELTAYCYRMLGSAFEADDAVQDTLIRAWRGLSTFEGRSALRSWLYRIATNVCLDMLNSRTRRARPMDFGPARPYDAHLDDPRPEISWLEPIPDQRLDPAELAVSRETVRLAFVAALQHLPPRQRAVLILREVLRWSAAEVSELLGASVASVNSALQRARATLAGADLRSSEPVDETLLADYVDAFQRYDMQRLTSLLHADATQSMPPYEMWLSGRENVLRFWAGPGYACEGSRLIATAANGTPAFAQYKPAPDGGYEAWALQVLESVDGQIVELSFFLDTATLFPMFGLPLRLSAS